MKKYPKGNLNQHKRLGDTGGPRGGSPKASKLPNY
jgi:hypothetical protein